jgi:hypothetical protein
VIKLLTWSIAFLGLVIIVLGIVVLVDASAVSITEPAKRCAPSIWQTQWWPPIYLGCVIAAHETLAAGLIGASVALLAAWIAFAAVLRQERQERDRTRGQQSDAMEVAKISIKTGDSRCCCCSADSRSRNG